MELKRKQLGLRPELTELKKFARENDVPFDKNAPNSEMFTELLTRISEDMSEEAKGFVKDLHAVRRNIIVETVKNPNELMTWLYEEQGIRRFDAANRFFLVLVDLKNPDDSWKLKRNKKLLKESINEYLDHNKNPDFERFKISFKWEERTYTTFSTCLFVLVE
jgi:hypothetical protein